MSQNSQVQNLINKMEYYKQQFDTEQLYSLSDSEIDILVLEINAGVEELQKDNFGVGVITNNDRIRLHHEYSELALDISAIKNNRGVKPPEIGVKPIERTAQDAKIINDAMTLLSDISNEIKGDLSFYTVTQLEFMLKQVTDAKQSLEKFTDTEIFLLRIDFDLLIEKIHVILDNKVKVEQTMPFYPIYYRSITDAPKIYKRTLLQFITVFDREIKKKVYFGKDGYLYMTVNDDPNFVQRQDNFSLRVKNWDQENTEYKFIPSSLKFDMRHINLLLPDGAFKTVTTIEINDIDYGKIEIGILPKQLKINEKGELTNINYADYKPQTRENSERFISPTFKSGVLYGLIGLSFITGSFTLFFVGKKVYKKIRYD